MVRITGVSEPTIILTNIAPYYAQSLVICSNINGGDNVLSLCFIIHQINPLDSSFNFISLTPGVSLSLAHCMQEICLPLANFTDFSVTKN